MGQSARDSNQHKRSSFGPQLEQKKQGHPLSIILRDYQTGGVAEIVQHMRRGVKRIVYVLSTGGGKTAVAAFMSEGSANRQQPVWFVVHRRELLYQTSDAFASYGIAHGLVASGEPLKAWHNVQVVLVGSLKSREKHLKAPSLIVPDEAHHARAASWEGMFARHPEAWVVGLTATPQRLDGRGLGKHFEQLVVGPTMRWLIDNGYLSDYRLFAPPPPNLDGVRTVAGEFNRADMKIAMERAQIVGNAIAEYAEHCNHQPAIVRAIDVESSQAIAARFCTAGYRAIHVDGMADRATRKKVFDGFRSGAYEVLCQVELAGEGVDIPGIVAAIDLRPTKSLTYALQFWGRALRPFYTPGMPLDTVQQRLASIAAGHKPKAVLLDHVGNVRRHGFPDDEHEWSLNDRTKRKDASSPIFACDACFAVFRVKHAICPECGAVMYDPNLAGGRAKPDEVNGSLHEITAAERAAEREEKRKADAEQQAVNKAKFDKKRELRACVTLEDFQALAAKRGYKPNWAIHVFNARQATIEKYRSGYPDRQGYA